MTLKVREPDDETTMDIAVAGLARRCDWCRELLNAPGPRRLTCTEAAS